MKDFFSRLNDSVRKFMTGRYGTDEYAKFLLTVTLVLCILTLFIRNWVMYLLTALAFAWSYYRILSKDFERRREENERFRALESRFGRWCRVQKRKFDGRREYRFFKCPNCEKRYVKTGGRRTCDNRACQYYKQQGKFYRFQKNDETEGAQPYVITFDFLNNKCSVKTQ